VPPLLAAVLGLVSIAAAAEFFARRSRARLLAQVRAGWGKPGTVPHRMDAIAEYHRSIVAVEGADNYLDDRTWTDLNLDKVFEHIDRSESILGQQALYHRLRRKHDVDGLNAFEQLVDRLSSDSEVRERVQLALTSLRDPSGYDLWWLAQPGALDRPRWHIIFTAWAIVVLVAIALIPFWPAVLIVPVVGVSINLIIRIRTAWRVSSVIGPFRQVSALIAVAERLRAANLSAPTTEAISTELPKLQRLMAIAWWVGRDPARSNELVAAFWEYLNLLFLLDVNVLHLAAEALRASGGSLLRVIALVGDVDAALAVASFRAGTRGWIRPRFPRPGNAAVLGGISHPLIADAVPNSIVLGPPHGVLITGSNMSGKSTFLRTVGITVVMAQTINTCLASTYEVPIVDLQSCIGKADDLAAGKSYYLVEVEEVLARVTASEAAAPHLFLFDELFRGTNAVERIAAGEAVLRELIGSSGHQKPHMVLAATHDAELVDLLHDSYCAYHFADTIGPTGLTFEYRLQSGPAGTRNAIALLELHGAPLSLINRALARANELDQQRKSPIA